MDTNIENIFRRAEGWIKEYCVEPELWKGASNIHILCYLLRDILKYFDGVDLIAGEVMVCEKHPWRLWPSGDKDCCGPGMPLSAAEGYNKQLLALQARLDEGR